MKFQFEELKSLLEMEGKVLGKVFYHLWNNRTVPSQPFIFIDKIEFLLIDGTSVMLGVTEEANGITVNNQNDDIEKMKLQLLHDFKGEITIHTRSMETSELWKLAIGETILNVKTQKMSDGTYSNQAVLFEFSNNHRVEISYQDDGLLAELYEVD